MTAITFDTLKFVRKLRDAGFDEKQAEAVAEAFKEASGEAELSTKRDIEKCETNLKQIITEVKVDLTLMKWMLGVIIAAQVTPWLIKLAA